MKKKTNPAITVFVAMGGPPSGTLSRTYILIQFPARHCCCSWLDLKPKEINAEAAFTTVVRGLASLKPLKTHRCAEVSRWMGRKLKLNVFIDEHKVNRKYPEVFISLSYTLRGSRNLQTEYSAHGFTLNWHAARILNHFLHIDYWLFPSCLVVAFPKQHSRQTYIYSFMFEGWGHFPSKAPLSPVAGWACYWCSGIYGNAGDLRWRITSNLFQAVSHLSLLKDIFMKFNHLFEVNMNIYLWMIF